MGLFDDTIRDAHRPLAGGWVRRAAAEEASGESYPASPSEQSSPAESAPDQLYDEPEDTGLQTVFRFQKAGSPSEGPREAPSRPGSGDFPPAAGDPLTAGAEVGSPRPPARNVRFTNVSAEGDRRLGNLETGHEEGGSPVAATAVEAESESLGYQSEVVSEPVETESNRVTHKSEATKGGSLTASLGVEAFQSRASGRGAPSESYAVEQRPRSPAAPAAGEPATTPASGVSPEVPPAAPPGFPPGAPTGSFAADQPRENAEVRRPGAAPVVPARPAGHSGYPPARSEPAEGEASGLVIGRIDVVVTAPEKPPKSRPTDSGERGFISRNYLKRL